MPRFAQVEPSDALEDARGDTQETVAG